MSNQHQKARDEWTVKSEREMAGTDRVAPFVLKVMNKSLKRIVYPTVLARSGQAGFDDYYKGDENYELIEYWRTSTYD